MMNISFQKENSDEEMATIDPESEDYGNDILAIVGFVVILIILEFLGNGLLFGIFIYEKYGIGKKHALKNSKGLWTEGLFISLRVNIDPKSDW